MRRRSRKFYSELQDLRDKYGEQVYSRDDILPAAMGLLRKHLKEEDELLKDAAIAILDSADKSDDRASEGLFPHSAHVHLGGKRRIKRGAMTFDTTMERKRVVDANKMAQDLAWSRETTWLNQIISELKDRPAGTRVRDLGSEPSSEAAE